MSISTAELENRIETARRAAAEFNKAARRKFGSRVRAIRLYGSFARGDADLDSDVDILVLLDRLKPQDRTDASNIAFHAGVLDNKIFISALVFSESQFRRLLNLERAFAIAAMREGMEL